MLMELDHKKLIILDKKNIVRIAMTNCMAFQISYNTVYIHMSIKPLTTIFSPKKSNCCSLTVNWTKC